MRNELNQTKYQVKTVIPLLSITLRRNLNYKKVLFFKSQINQVSQIKFQIKKAIFQKVYLDCPLLSQAK